MTRYIDVHGLPVVRFATLEAPGSIGPVFLVNGLDLDHIEPDDGLRLPHDPCSIYWRDPFLAFLASVTRDHASGVFGGVRCDVTVQTLTGDDDRCLAVPAALDLGGRRHVFRAWSGRAAELDDEVTAQILDRAAGIVSRVLTLLAIPAAITYEPVKLGPHMLRRQARGREPRVDYRVLKLPDGTRTHGRSVPVDGAPAGVKLHTVRGHFATYTAAAPLFGQHVGTFWRKPAVRGTADHGAVVKDYDAGRTTA